MSTHVRSSIYNNNYNNTNDMDRHFQQKSLPSSVESLLT